MQKEIRIVIPAFNASTTITYCVEAIIDSINYHNSWEIIVVDNGLNTDLSLLQEKYPVTVIKRDNNQSAAYARNEGAKDFNKGKLIFIDSDVICEKNCLKLLLEPIQMGLSNASIGNYSKNIAGLSFSQKYKQLYINNVYNRKDIKIKNDFWTAICAVDAEVFNKLNGFNSNFKGANGEDQEFGIRLTKSGYNVLSVKTANGQHLNSYGVYNIIRNDLKKGLTAVKNSIINKVPLSDNRHSKTTDIIAVFFSVLIIIALVFSIINLFFLPVILLFCIIWFLSRMSLSYAFLKHAGTFFFLRALLLMYFLDLVRFTCVIVGFAKYKIIKLSVE